MHSGRSGSGASLQKSFLRAPAVAALLIQLISLLIVFALAIVMATMVEVQLTLVIAALLQGGVAALISRWQAMAPWWLLIQFLFPIALIAFNALHLPSEIYLAAFIALLFLYWTTFRTQVPYYPSTRAVREAVGKLLTQGQSLRFIDIGSGFGGMVLHLASLRPESDFSGIEVAPMPWLASALRAQLGSSRARFVLGDYGKLDFGAYDVVFAYLSPAAMPALWGKARAEMRQGALLLSYEFPIPGVDPHQAWHPVDGGPPLYGWYF